MNTYTIESLTDDLAAITDRPRVNVYTDVVSVIDQLLYTEDVLASGEIEIKNASGRVIGWDHALTNNASTLIIKELTR